ncbi:MAG: glycosyltransferase [Chitinophagales bacterium]|nr:glycosyltransferase [Chitinophagales bacterium]
MYVYQDWAAIIPMANEEEDFNPFVELLTKVLDAEGTGKIYFIIDNVSKDRTLEMAQELSKKDPRFEAVFAPENRSVVDAYLKGFRVAYDRGHELIIEMDAGLSHDPRAIPMFLRVLNEGNECAFGSRFINGGSMGDSPFKRRTLSKTGTTLANILLGTKLHDMTSGFQGFHRNVIKAILDYKLKSTAHFYQTELRYLLRKRRIFEVPIHYQAPSPRVSSKAIKNANETLLWYFKERIKGNHYTI